MVIFHSYVNLPEDTLQYHHGKIPRIDMEIHGGFCWWLAGKSSMSDTMILPYKNTPQCINNPTATFDDTGWYVKIMNIHGGIHELYIHLPRTDGLDISKLAVTVQIAAIIGWF